ncbi:MAG TPA: O-antigen ligase family protein [Gemmatimonadales bacterium]
MSAEAVLAGSRTDAGSVRRSLILLAVATLPFTYALTVDLSFPLKAYEVALALVLLTYLNELRLPLAPGTRRMVRGLGWFVVAAAVLTLIRFTLPAEGSTTGDFGARFGPAGDAVAKLLYLALGVLGFMLFAYVAYADERRYLRAWRIGAIAAATYSWYLFAAGLLGMDPFLLPGVTDPKYFSVAGRTFVRSGTFQEGNFLGLFLLVSAGVALYERRRLLAAVLSLTVLLTFSTVNTLALALLWTIVWWRSHSAMTWSRRPRYIALGIGVALAVVLVLFLTGYLQSVIVGKLGTEELGSRIKRITFILAGLRMFLDHPLLGVGISQFGYFYNSYQPLGLVGMAETVKLIPNNIYVELLAELGIAGFLLFAAFLVAVYRRLRAPELAPLRWTFIAVLFSLNGFPTFTVMFLWAFFGLAVGASARHSGPEPVPRGA